MAHSSVEKLPGEPIVVSILDEGFQVERDMPAGVAAGWELLESLDEKVFLITDVTNMQGDFGDVMMATELGHAGKTPMYKHPNIREVIFVTDVDLLRAAAEGLGSDAFGNMNVRVFGTLDEALAYARSQN